MEITKQNIFNALSTITDPIGGKDIISSNFFKSIDVSGLEVSIHIELPSHYSKINELEVKQAIIEGIHKSVNENIIFNIKFTTKPEPIRPQNRILPDVKNIIAIASGKGGVGKSTVTSNLAVALNKQGYKVGIVDADIFGPSIPTMFGVEDKKPMVMPHEGKNYIVPIKKYDIKLISIGFLAPPDSAVVWRGPMASSALRQFFTDCDWGTLDYLLIDLPPGTSDIHLTMVQTVPLTGALVVTTPQKVALSDAKKAIAMFKQPQINVPVLGIVENMAYFTPVELPQNKYYIFGKDGGFNMAKEMGIPFLGQIPLVQSIREHGDEGKPQVIAENDITSEAFLNLAKELTKQINLQSHRVVEENIINLGQ